LLLEAAGLPSSQASIGREGWDALLEQLLDGEELWQGFSGMSGYEVLTSDGVPGEMRLMQLAGVHNAQQLVLRAGPRRCRQVRRWAQRRRSRDNVRNVGGLIASVILKGEPRGGR
jgi:hypothetical protein